MKFDPPAYSDPPSYSAEPSSGEERLVINARQATPNGTFFKQGQSFNIVLRAQEDGATRPSYGRAASISGAINLKTRGDFKDIVLKFTGTLEIISPEVGRYSQDLLDENYTLWTSQDGEINESDHGALPFSLTLPVRFNTGATNESAELPPSIAFSDSSLTIKVNYTITVIASKQRRTIWKSSEESLSIEMEYYPRSRPANPIASHSEFLESVKLTPGRWFQSQSEVNVGGGTIGCDFFLPGLRVFALSDKIPFHVQLSGTSTSLKDFMPPSYESQSKSNGSERIEGTGDGKSWKERTIQVEVVRQILVLANGHRSWTTIVLGEAQLTQILPPEHGSADRDDQIHLHWEGSVQCRNSVRIASFNVGKLVFKDFIVLSSLPSPTQDASAEKFKLPVSCTFVTDPWVDSTSRADAQANARISS